MPLAPPRLLRDWPGRPASLRARPCRPGPRSRRGLRVGLGCPSSGRRGRLDFGLTLLAALILLLAGGARPAQAVTYQEQIERLRLIYALLLDYRSGQAPEQPAMQVVNYALELIPVPSIDHRVGAKDEPIDPPAVIPRLRYRKAYQRGFMLGVTLSPRVLVAGYRAGWFGGEAGLRAGLGPVVGEARGFLLAGKVEGPITMAGVVDTFGFQNQGLDLRVGWPFDDWRVYGGVGRGKAKTNLTISSDSASFVGTHRANYAFAGVGWTAGPWQLTLEQQVNGSVLAYVILSGAIRY